MLKDAAAVIENLIPLRTQCDILEKQLVAKFGGDALAKRKARLIRKKYASDGEFLEFNIEFIYPKNILALLSPMLHIKNFTELVEYTADLNQEKLQTSFTEEDIVEFIRMQEIYNKELNLIVFKNKKVLFNQINKKVRFSIIEIRNDLNLNQRTFKKWLQFFFKDKYDGVRTISLTEYIEIYEQLILKEQEKKFNFNFNAEEYLKRIQNGLVFNKQRLLKITQSDYKQLSIKMKSMKFYALNATPYKIAQQIIEAMG